MSEDHNIDIDALLDHATDEHQEMTRRLAVALEGEKDRDPAFCTYCAAIGISIAKVTQLQYLVDVGTDHEKTEYQPLLEDALRERMAVPIHGAKAAAPS